MNEPGKQGGKIVKLGRWVLLVPAVGLLVIAAFAEKWQDEGAMFIRAHPERSPESELWVWERRVDADYDVYEGVDSDGDGEEDRFVHIDGWEDHWRAFLGADSAEETKRVKYELWTDARWWRDNGDGVIIAAAWLSALLVVVWAALMLPLVIRYLYRPAAVGAVRAGLAAKDAASVHARGIVDEAKEKRNEPTGSAER